MQTEAAERLPKWGGGGGGTNKKGHFLEKINRTPTKGNLKAKIYINKKKKLYIPTIL